MGIQSQRGSSLIEVMVALFVLAIGLLGVLAMQAKSIKFNQSAFSYSKAVYLANTMAEGIRLNGQNLDAYSTEDNAQTAGQAPNDAAKNCADENCSAQELAEWEITEWRQSLVSALPLARGEIAVLPGPDGEGGVDYAQISIFFDDSRVNSNVVAAEEGAEEADTPEITVQQYQIVVGI